MSYKKVFREQFEEITKFLRINKQVLQIALRVRPKATVSHILGGIIETVASILTIYASAKLASLLAEYVTTGKSDYIWLWLWVDIGAAVLTGLGFWVMRYSERLIYFSMNIWCVDVFMRALSVVDINDYYDNETRNNINKAQNGYEWQIPNLSHMVLELIYGLIRFAAIAVVVAQINWWLIFVIAIFLVPTLFSDGRIARVSWLIWGDKGDNRHVFHGIWRIMSKPMEQMEIRSMQTRDYLLQKVHGINKNFFAEQERKYRKASKFSLGSKVFEVGGVAIGSILLLKQFLSGALSLEKYFFLSGALLRVGGALNAIFGTLSRIQDPLQFADNFFKIIDTTPKIADQKHAVIINGDSVATIEFRDVSFTYPGQKEPIFKGLSFMIKPGEHVALVGENGAGKSSIIKLLMRFYVPDSGEILINDTNINDVAIETWYRQLATLFQTFNEYPFPIDENIYIARPLLKDNHERLDRAARFAGVDELVEKFDHGWETVLDASFKKGVEPSGGQWQRVALARAFYRDSNILILDEPTSAIDAKAEYNIFNNIFDHYQNKTTIIVSHRFSTVRRADRIIVIDKGKIIEQGPHKVLMQQKNLYHEMFTKQAEGYK